MSLFPRKQKSQFRLPDWSHDPVAFQQPLDLQIPNLYQLAEHVVNTAGAGSRYVAMTRLLNVIHVQTDKWAEADPQFDEIDLPAIREALSQRDDVDEPMQLFGYLTYFGPLGVTMASTLISETIPSFVNLLINAAREGHLNGGAGPNKLISDPGLPETDIRQVISQFLQGNFVYAFVSPLPVEETLTEAAKRFPSILESEIWSGSVMRFIADKLTPWCAVESKNGSAVFVFHGQDSQGDLMTQAEINLADGEGPFELGFIENGGFTSTSIADITNGLSVVPVWDVPGFEHMAPSGGYTDLPIAVRRLLDDWEPISSNAYRTSAYTPWIQEYAPVFGGLWDVPGWPVVFARLGSDLPEELLQQLAADDNYSLGDLDGWTFLLRRIPPGTTKSRLDEMVKELLSAPLTALEALQS